MQRQPLLHLWPVLWYSSADFELDIYYHVLQPVDRRSSLEFPKLGGRHASDHAAMNVHSSSATHSVNIQC